MSPKPDLFPEAWPAIKATLAADASPVQWHMAISKSLDPRLRFRYLDPIKAISDSRKLKEEGFLILTIQCSIIEFLASLRRGWNFRRGGQWGVNFEYGVANSYSRSFSARPLPSRAGF